MNGIQRIGIRRRRRGDEILNALDFLDSFDHPELAFDDGVLMGDFRIEAGRSGISPCDLIKWGELKGKIAWSILTYSETMCSDKKARLALLKLVTEDIVLNVEGWVRKKSKR